MLARRAFDNALQYVSFVLNHHIKTTHQQECR